MLQWCSLTNINQCSTASLSSSSNLQVFCEAETSECCNFAVRSPRVDYYILLTHTANARVILSQQDHKKILAGVHQPEVWHDVTLALPDVFKHQSFLNECGWASVLASCLASCFQSVHIVKWLTYPQYHVSFLLNSLKLFQDNPCLWVILLKLTNAAVLKLIH